jgi:hypothetical protein
MVSHTYKKQQMSFPYTCILEASLEIMKKKHLRDHKHKLFMTSYGTDMLSNYI